MRLAMYSIGGSPMRPALITPDDRIVDIGKHLHDAPTTMIGILERLDRLRGALAERAKGPGDHALKDVKLGPPVTRPGKILALGLNYKDHAAEAKMELPTVQTWFSKMTTSTNGPYEPVDLPRVSDKLDYEAELAFVIGKRTRHATREQAKAAIAGYCCANDVSVRDWQLRTTQFVIGKSFDTHCPFGPWITTADEVPDPQSLRIQAFVNGESRQDSNTREMVFDVYAMVEHLSQAMTLEPGDLVLTGTPAGVGAVRNPRLYMKAGDVVRVEIERLGYIENEIVVESD